MERVREMHLPIARSKDEKRRIILKVAFAFFLLLVLSIGIILSLSIYVGWTLTHPARLPLHETPAKYGMKFEDISFKTEDNLLLNGWFIPSEANGYPSNGKTIIFVHSYAGNRLEEGFDILKLAKTLQRLGYDAFMFDLRASGESEGQMVSIGHFEKLDVNAAVQTIKNIVPESKIIVMGFSMGASTAILAAGENKDINAVVADSPFANLEPFLSENLSHWSGLPDFLFTPFIMGVFPHLTGIKPSLINPSEEIQKFSNHQSVYLIHGLADNSISYLNSKQLNQKVPHQKHELWLVPGADHVTSNKVEPKEYRRRLIQFLKNI